MIRISATIAGRVVRALARESENNIARGTPGVRVQTVNVNLVVQKVEQETLHFDENESVVLPESI
jgi:hypothetical protein